MQGGSHGNQHAHREQRKMICYDLLELSENEGDNFLAHIVTGDETWLHHYESERDHQLRSIRGNINKTS